MNNREFAELLLCEAIELLNEGIFSSPKKIYSISLSDRESSIIFGLLSEKDAVLDYLNSYFNKDGEKYILPKKSIKFGKYYLFEHTVKKYEKSSQDNGKYHRDLYLTSNKKDIILSRVIKTFNSIEDLAKFVGKDVVEGDQSDERKKIIRFALSKLRSAKLYGVSLYSIKNDDIEYFINGDDDIASLGCIDFTDLYDDDSKVNKYTKDIVDELKNINKLIDNKKYTLEDDWDKYEGDIFLRYKH